jgi:hypothetical protein
MTRARYRIRNSRLKTYRLEEYVGPATWMFALGADAATAEEAREIFASKFPRANILPDNPSSYLPDQPAIGDCRIEVTHYYR